MRILVDVSQQQLDALRAIGEKRGSARAELVRQALDRYIAAEQEPLSSFFGLWADNPETQDVQAYLDRIRGEWEK